MKNKTLENNLFKFDQNQKQDQTQLILGIDEVGRGSWAGPLVVAGVILEPDYFNLAIQDSKQLSPAQRENLATEIKKHAQKFVIIFISSQDVDKLNPTQATIRAMVSVIEQLEGFFDLVLVDYLRIPKLNSSIKTVSITKGDAKSLSIAAASILAKVARDQYMKELSVQFPYYGFETNVGYGTKKHAWALKKYGVLVHHRRSYKPIKKILAAIKENQK